MLKYCTMLVIIPLLFSCDYESKKEVAHSNCIGNKPCNYSGGYTISLENELITPEEKFVIKFNAPENSKIQQAKLEGVNMYMGSIPLFFEYKNGIWQSNAMVGACAEPIMHWRLTLDFINAQQIDKVNQEPRTLLYYFTSKY
ncbi:hypothetical protein CJF42_19095 [Pseudoalteromonas sp. NBT06-2]|uniref:hypothetical protein n=1 Tax=Pseudoalteromonas sp. NBT06-2 TaxID=2025950 RepID=UPI000BCEB02F|nr:hypothetical protein [Pseudoalteromonas sp. NBT06-2]PAJ72817.1 hypothetical protein CJF42_19095 [Pseudoalteromonas sp. NBT06-2]